MPFQLIIANEVNALDDYEYISEGLEFGGHSKVLNKAKNEFLMVKMVPKTHLQGVFGQELGGEILRHRRQTGHPFVVEFKHVFQTDTYFAIAMEFTELTLKRYIDTQGAISESETRRYLRQIVSVLQLSYVNNITSRQISLENLAWIPENGDVLSHIKVCDFKYSKDSVNSSNPMELARQLAYTSPEVQNCLPNQTYDVEKRDVWATGVVLYGLLAGKLPFDPQQMNISRMIPKITEGNYEVPNAVSDLAKDLIQHMLDPDPKTRYGLSDILQHRWFQEGHINHLPPNYVQLMLKKQASLQSEENIQFLINYIVHQQVLSSCQHLDNDNGSFDIPHELLLSQQESY